MSSVRDLMPCVVWVTSAPLAVGGGAYVVVRCGVLGRLGKVCVYVISFFSLFSLGCVFICISGTVCEPQEYLYVIISFMLFMWASGEGSCICNLSFSHFLALVVYSYVFLLFVNLRIISS